MTDQTDSLTFQAAASADFEAALALVSQGHPGTKWPMLADAIEKAIADPEDAQRRAGLWSDLALAQKDAHAAADRIDAVRNRLDSAYRLRGLASRLEAEAAARE